MNNTNQMQQRIAPYAHLFRISHWILAAGMIFLIFSGYGIHSVSMPSWSLLGRYPSFYPIFRAIYWHKIVGIVFAPASIIALIYFFPKVKNLKLSNSRKIANILIVVSGVVSTVTSLGLIYTNIPAPLYHACRFLHALSGMLVAPLSLLTHIYLAVFKYFRLLVPSFAPFRQSRWLQLIWLAIGLAISWCLFTRYLPYHSSLSVLTAQKISQSVSSADKIATLPWHTARPLEMQLVNGVGFDFGVTRAGIKALYNNEYLYMTIQWKDSVYNRIYRPWIKTDTGWMHLNPGGSDEIIYNEDKIAIIYPIKKDADFQRHGCAIYCHNDGKSGYGFHWTPENRLVDVWHWKSVRMDPIGYVDDQYWLGMGKATTEKNGRYGDPGEQGYANNMVEGISHPMMLPASMDAINMGALPQSKAEIYTKTAADRFPVGSEIPGIIISEPEGDRADVQCHSTYENNTWTVRLMRKLDTASRYDVIFKPGEEYDFTMAAFDHSARRHAYNNQAYRLYLEK
jgi:hypothetical protein